jgi:hypothetical protein
MASRFKSNLRFALQKEVASQRALFPPNRVEQVGNVLAWFAYEFKAALVKTICEPRFVTVCLTLFAMTFAAILFYPTTTLTLLFDTIYWISKHINGSYCRFTLWMISEVTILGIGLRAFGRFSNQKLMEFHRIG